MNQTMNEKLKEKALERVHRYKNMDPKALESDGIKDHMVHMAQGGDGSINYMGNIRDKYYEGYPNEFFQLICKKMGWKY